MAIDLTSRIFHELDDAKLASMLEMLQGNVIKFHGRQHSIYVFLTFIAPAERVRKRLIPLLDRYVTSATAQRQQAAAHRKAVQSKQAGGGSEPFGSFMLSAAGYAHLGFTPDQLAALFPEHNGAGEPSFKAGMHDATALQDPPPETWEETYRRDSKHPGKKVHALLLLAHSDFKLLNALRDKLVEQLKDVARVAGVESGNLLVDNLGRGIEHFGYVDGRSQPVFFKQDLDEAAKAWNPHEPLGLVLTRDRTVEHEDALGSYFVFRKLEQDVSGFKQRERDLAGKLHLAPGDEERAGAMVVGRFRDGSPLLLNATRGGPLVADNDFRFDEENMRRCPFQAHIRKANPRGDLSKNPQHEDELERRHRILRRGVPYGAPGDAKVGLLFGCYQADISQQFAFIQTRWLNDPGFAVASTGQDPLAANHVAGAPLQRWVADRKGTSKPEHFDFGHFIEMKGGEFFFAPSRPFLKRLSP